MKTFITHSLIGALLLVFLSPLSSQALTASSLTPNEKLTSIEASLGALVVRIQSIKERATILTDSLTNINNRVTGEIEVATPGDTVVTGELLDINWNVTSNSPVSVVSVALVPEQVQPFVSYGVYLGSGVSASSTRVSVPQSLQDGLYSLKVTTAAGGVYFSDTFPVTGVPETTPEPEVEPEPILETTAQASGPQVQNNIIYPIEVFRGVPKVVDASLIKGTNTETVIITMDAIDADNPNEGSLFVNGNGPITLFGDQGQGANDSITVEVSFETPGEWWRDGTNTLRFLHSNTAGYAISGITLETTASTTPQNQPVSTGPTSTPADARNVPFTISPSEASATYLMLTSIPSGTNTVDISMLIFDADQTNEGSLFVNGNGPITLFGSQGQGGDSVDKEVVFSTPRSWWNNGQQNELSFSHNQTAGFEVKRIQVIYK